MGFPQPSPTLICHLLWYSNRQQPHRDAFFCPKHDPHIDMHCRMAFQERHDVDAAAVCVVDPNLGSQPAQDINASSLQASELSKAKIAKVRNAQCTSWELNVLDRSRIVIGTSGL
jgi:hypothetical protein